MQYCCWWRYVYLWSPHFHEILKPMVCYNFKGSGTFWDPTNNLGSMLWQVSHQSFIKECPMYLISVLVFIWWENIAFPFPVHWKVAMIEPEEAIGSIMLDLASAAFWHWLAINQASSPQQCFVCLIMFPVEALSFDCIKVLSTNVLAAMSSTLELVASLCGHVGYYRDWVVEGIYWGFPILQQALWIWQVKVHCYMSS